MVVFDKMKLNTKKGVSPLVATILLVAFAIALGAVVMSYGSAYYSNKQVGGAIVTTSPIEQCEDVVINIYKIGGKQQICFGGEAQDGYINFMLDNQGNVNIEELLVTVIGERGSKEYQLRPFIGKGQLYDKRDRTTTYNFEENGKIFQIQFRPYIKSEGKSQVCIDKQITIEDIQPC